MEFQVNFSPHPLLSNNNFFFEDFLLLWSSKLLAHMYGICLNVINHLKIRKIAISYHDDFISFLGILMVSFSLLITENA